MEIQRLRNVLAGGHPVTGPYSDDPAASAAQINAPNIVEAVAVEAAEIKRYLMMAGGGAVWLTLRSSQAPASILARDALAEFESFRLNEPAIATAVAGILDGLVTAEILASQDKANLLAMGTRLVSHAEQAGLGFVGEQHIVRARMSDPIEPVEPTEPTEEE